LANAKKDTQGIKNEQRETRENLANARVMNNKYSHFIMDQLELMIDQNNIKPHKVEEEAKSTAELAANAGSIIEF